VRYEVLEVLLHDLKVGRMVSEDMIEFYLTSVVKLIVEELNKQQWGPMLRIQFTHEHIVNFIFEYHIQWKRS
jgi:hypothetical protein